MDGRCVSEVSRLWSDGSGFGTLDCLGFYLGLVGGRTRAACVCAGW